MYQLKIYLNDDERLEDHSEQGTMASTAFCALMDANIMLTRVFSDLTNARRESAKMGLGPQAAAVLSDKNPATPEWLAGADIHAEMERVVKERKDAEQFKKVPFSSFSANKSTGYQGNKNSNQPPQSKDKWKKGGVVSQNMTRRSRMATTTTTTPSRNPTRRIFSTGGLARDRGEFPIT